MSTVMYPPKSKTVARIYSSSGSGGSHDGALTAYYDRRVAEVRDDKTRLERDRAERREVRAFFERHGVLPDDAHTALSTLRHYEVHPREIKETHWTRSLEALRQEERDESSARAIFERARTGAAVLERELPGIAARAVQTGAVSDPNMMRFMAAFADDPVQQK
jgi:hypothetical protein